MIRQRRMGQRGAALVEFAICASLLLVLLFGIIDVGLLLSDRAALGEAAREAARSLAVGSAPTVAANRAVAASSLPLTSADVALQECVPSSSGAPTTWAAVGVSSGGGNDAASGDFVQATVTYNHPLITSLILSGNSVPLTASVVMRRE